MGPVTAKEPEPEQGLTEPELALALQPGLAPEWGPERERAPARARQAQREQVQPAPAQEAAVAARLAQAAHSLPGGEFF